jgi:hypothetical protein
MILTVAAVTAGLATTVIVATVVLVGLVVLALRAIDDESGGSGPGSDGRGGGNDRPRPRPDRGGDPAWWPEFERELDRYAAERDASADARNLA